MSTAKRIISGSAASWANLGIAMVSQILVVPVFLSYWNVQTYGVWIAMQAMVFILTTLDRGYIDYLGYEFLSIGEQNKSSISKYLFSGLWATLLIAGIEFLLIFAFCFSAKLPFFLGERGTVNADLMYQAGWTLLLQWVGWTFFTNITGLFYRALTVFGYFPRMIWFDVFSTLFTTLVSVMVVVLGGDLLSVGIYTTIGLFIVTLPRYFDIIYLFKKEKIPFVKGSVRAGIKSYAVSLALSGRYFLENFKLQGIRLILAPLAGTVVLAQFSTMRTAANAVQQGLFTITKPMLPELMRFLNQREQKKTEAAFGSIWMVVIAGLVPFMVCLQAIAEPLFSVWTKGQIHYDPILFFSLSFSLLVYAWAQPSMSVIIANNQLKEQVMIAVITALLVIGGMLILVPAIGIKGAGFSLLAAELLAANGFNYYAKKWLEAKNLQWPAKQAGVTLSSLVLGATGMLTMIAFPHFKWIILSITVLLLLWNAIRYWRMMPELATRRVIEMLKKIFKIKGDYSVKQTVHE